MNGKELIEKLNNKLKKIKLSKDHFADGNYSNEVEEEIIKEFGEYSIVYDARDDFGDHDSYTKVWYFSTHKVYISLTGAYNSWNGADYSYADFKQVEPREITTTVYQEVK